MNKFLKKIKNINEKPSFRKRGNGQSLGGSKPGEVVNIVLSDPGPLGVQVEKSANEKGYAIISSIVPGSQAEAAGLLRGDVVCHANCDGEEEIMYKQFLLMASSKNRPLIFDVRRIATVSKPSTNLVYGGRISAESESRRKAVIAAAEARDKAHKKATRPIAKTGLMTAAEKKRVEMQKEEFASYNAQHMMKDKPLSEETKKAVQAAKKDEVNHAAALGYNPYEQANMTAGQAKNASIAMNHGSVTADEAKENNSPTPTAVKQQSESDFIDPIFDDAFTTLVTENSDRKQLSPSLTIMRKLIINATTKGQQGEEESSSKFRKVRLSNPKIKAAVADMNGGIEVMIAVGFELHEVDKETHLVFPLNDNGPSWLSKALRRMESAT